MREKNKPSAQSEENSSEENGEDIDFTEAKNKRKIKKNEKKDGKKKQLERSSEAVPTDHRLVMPARPEGVGGTVIEPAGGPGSEIWAGGAAAEKSQSHIA